MGQVILDAITNKVTNFYIGLGGTISNDGGKGMLEALGFEFKEKVIKNSSIDYSKYNFHIISDVKNTLLGKNGATYTYAIQKGAVKSLLPVLEHKMKEFSDKITNFLSVDYTNHIGSGAAGGLGFAFLSILNAKYHNGINFILNHLNIDSIVDKYDLIITGEGKIDYQSIQGKIVFELLSRYNKKILILCAINDVKNKNNTIKSIVPDITCVEKSLKRPKYYFTKLIKSLKL